ncbi:MAG: RidA family protein [Gemmatimonadales bacterium]
MRTAILFAITLPLAACAQSGQRERGGQSPQPFASGPTTPVVVTAPDVAVLAGLPQAIRSGYTVYVSGMVPLDSAGRLVGAGDLTAQTKQAVTNLGAVMRAAGGVLGDVVRATVYVRDLDAAKVTTVRKALLDNLDRASPPAVTIIGVAAFPERGIELTIEAIGQLRSQFPDRTRMTRRR